MYLVFISDILFLFLYLFRSKLTEYSIYIFLIWLWYLPFRFSSNISFCPLLLFHSLFLSFASTVSLFFLSPPPPSQDGVVLCLHQRIHSVSYGLQKFWSSYCSDFTFYLKVWDHIGQWIIGLIWKALFTCGKCMWYKVVLSPNTVLDFD